MSRKSRNRDMFSEEQDVKTGHYNIRKGLKFKNEAQKIAYDTISKKRISFLCGPAGTAKSFLCVNYALDEMYKGKTSKIIFTRPMIEACGEKMGYLPGSFAEKIGPYMTPLFDFLHDSLTEKEIAQHVAQKTIEVRPLAFMRGCTFKNAIIVADEMQNAKFEQIKMLLSRIGEGTKILLTGDTQQTDLLKKDCCFDSVAKSLSSLDFIGYYKFEKEHIVREEIISHILDKMEEVKNGWE
jgi:phosphate starvation-inducible PhoH-like protein